MAKKKALKYFYTTYSFTSNDGRTGVGAVTFQADFGYLKLKEACNWVKETNNFKQVFLLNWQEINKEQYQEWNQIN